MSKSRKEPLILFMLDSVKFITSALIVVREVVRSTYRLVVEHLLDGEMKQNDFRVVNASHHHYIIGCVGCNYEHKLRCKYFQYELMLGQKNEQHLYIPGRNKMLRGTTRIDIGYMSTIQHSDSDDLEGDLYTCGTCSETFTHFKTYKYHKQEKKCNRQLVHRHMGESKDAIQRKEIEIDSSDLETDYEEGKCFTVIAESSSTSGYESDVDAGKINKTRTIKDRRGKHTTKKDNKEAHSNDIKGVW
ncbi:hypothetical protein AM593_06487, partial [Mytilus galloprovincialis]